MYGLFKYVYDHHEWEELIAVANTRERLAVRYVSEKSNKHYPLTIIDTEHQQMADNEEVHFVIKKVEYI